MIHEEIVTYEVAKLAKEKGFNVPTIRYYLIDTVGWVKTAIYNNWNDSTIRYSAPTQSLLQRWLREEKDIQIIIKPTLDDFGAWIWGHYSWVIFIFNEYQPIYYSRYHGDNFTTYELVLENALKYSLENLV